MIMLTGKDKVKVVEQKIIKDLSEKIDAKSRLPYVFSAPKRIDKNICEVTSKVITLNGVDYPQDMFLGYGYFQDGMVAFIKEDYLKLGAVYETLGGDYIGGIRDASGAHKDLNECINELKFELDLKAMKYKQIKANEKTENATQMGE